MDTLGYLKNYLHGTTGTLRNKMTRFTIVATDAENHVPRDRMREGIESLNNQTFKDFELLIIHDGPREGSYDNELDDVPENTGFINTEKHYGIYENSFGRKCGYGHHSRDLGIKNARGDYILNFNIDNLLRPDCLYKLNKLIEQEDPDVIIFPVEYRGIDRTYILPGLPPEWTYIDLIQCVAKKTAWDSIGGFHMYNIEADGILIEKLTKKYDYLYFNEVLAVNR